MLDKDLLTGEVAKIAHVSHRTVCKWFDTGMLKGGYLVPGTKHRRFPRLAVLGFLREHQMPIPKWLERLEPQAG